KIREFWRSRWTADKLNRKSKRQFICGVVDLDRLEKFEHLRAGVPRHPVARFRDVVAFESRNRNAIDFCSAKLVDELQKVTFDLLVTVAVEVDEVHFVDGDDEVPDSKQVRDERMAA